MADIVSYKSKFDRNFNVYVLYPEDGGVYTQFKNINPTGDIAFTDMTKKIILVDGPSIESLTKDQLNFIECHEIAHHMLKHNSTHGKVSQEMEADLGAALLLYKHGLKSAATLIRKFWKVRFKGISFDKFKTKYGEIVAHKMNTSTDILEIL